MCGAPRRRRQLSREKRSDIALRAPQQRCATAAQRLTNARARNLIAALVGHD